MFRLEQLSQDNDYAGEEGSNKVLTVSRRTTKGMVLDAEKVGSNSQFSGIERDISEPIQEIRKRFRIAAKNDG